MSTENGNGAKNSVENSGPVRNRLGQLVGGNPRNSGGKKGRSGRKPEEFKVLCQQLASGAPTIKAARAILKDKDHPAWRGALQWATENGYGRPRQSVDVTSGGQPVRFTLALGSIGADDSDG